MSAHGDGEGIFVEIRAIQELRRVERDTAVVLGFLLPLERHRHPTTSLTSSLPRFTAWGCSINLRSWSEMLTGRIQRSGPVARVELDVLTERKTRESVLYPRTRTWHPTAWAFQRHGNFSSLMGGANGSAGVRNRYRFPTLMPRKIYNVGERER